MSTPKTTKSTPEETNMSTNQNDYVKHAEKLAAETWEQTEAFRVKSLELGRQFAELSLDTTEKAVKQGTDLYLRAAEQFPYDLWREVAKTQVELTLRATESVVKQSRELINR
jgi:hypothetical protein